MQVSLQDILVMVMASHMASIGRIFVCMHFKILLYKNLFFEQVGSISLIFILFMVYVCASFSLICR